MVTKEDLLSGKASLFAGSLEGVEEVVNPRGLNEDGSANWEMKVVCVSGGQKAIVTNCCDEGEAKRFFCTNFGVDPNKTTVNSNCLTEETYLAYKKSSKKSKEEDPYHKNSPAESKK